MTAVGRQRKETARHNQSVLKLADHMSEFLAVTPITEQSVTKIRLFIAKMVFLLNVSDRFIRLVLAEERYGWLIGLVWAGVNGLS